MQYSADGAHLAFVSWRKAGQSYIAIHDFRDGTDRYIDPQIYRDLSPTWSPDGTRLVFARVPGNWTREYRFSAANAGAPWSLMVADVTGERVHEIWRAERGKGSVFRAYGTGSWLEADMTAPQLVWTRFGDILFPWERTGWLSLYAVASAGGKARMLSSGKGEVGTPSVSSDGRHLIFASNSGDLPRLHLWRVSLRDGLTKQLTSGEGVEHSPVFMGDEAFAYIANDKGRIPNRRRVWEADRHVTLTPEREQGLWRQFVDQQIVPVTAADGVTSYHLVVTPVGKVPRGGYPVIVASKGGPEGHVLPGNSVYAALGQYAASRGYLFVEINYRGCDGFGLDYRLPPGRGATGGSEVEDLRALVKYLRSRPDVDAARVGIMGGSYGGHLVGLALTRLPEYFAAGVHMSGVSDWVLEMKLDERDEGWRSAPPDTIRLSERMRIEDLAYESSPPAHIPAWRAPTLITIGELDTSGHTEAIIDLGYRLLEQGTHVEFSVAPEAGHVGPRARPQDRAFEFFERFLK